MISLMGDIKSKIIIFISFFLIGLLAYSNILKNKLAEEERKQQELAANIEMQNRSIAEWKKEGDDLKLRLASAEKKAKIFEIASNKREKKYEAVKNGSCEDAAIWAASVAPELLHSF